MDVPIQWNSMVEPTYRTKKNRTLEVNKLKALNLHTESLISSQYVIETQGDLTTRWISDGLLSTIQGLRVCGYISSLYTTLYLDYVSSVTPLSLYGGYISTSPISIVNSNYKRTNVFSDGTISTHTAVVYGSNTLVVQGAISMYDKPLDKFTPLRLSNGVLITNTNGSFYVSHFDIISTIDGLVTGSYVSTASLASTNQGLIGTISYKFLTSTVNGLGTMSYVSTKSYNSTVYNLIEYGGTLKKYQMGSTIDGLASASYISTTSFMSTVTYLFNKKNVLSPQLFIFTIRSLPNVGYISSAVLASTYNGLVVNFLLEPYLLSTVNSLGLNYASTSCTDIFLSNIVVEPDLLSTVGGFGTSRYISSISFLSTIEFMFLNMPYQVHITSTIAGLDKANYISSMDLTSTLDYLDEVYINKIELQSSIKGLESVYVSTSALRSTVSDILFQGITSNKVVLRSTVKGISKTYATVSNLCSTIYNVTNPAFNISFANYLSTFDTLGSSKYVSSLHLASSMDFVLSNIYFDYQITSSIDGAVLSNCVSTIDLASTLDGMYNNLFVRSQLNSTIEGLEIAGYISTMDIVSTLDFIGSNQANKGFLRSTVEGLGTSYYVSTLSLRSTVAYLTTQTIFPRVLTSTVRGLGQLYMSTGALRSTTKFFLNNTNLVNQQTFNSTIATLALRKYVSTSQLTSTLSKVLSKYILMNTIISTVDGLAFAKYVSSTDFASTIDGLFLSYPTSNECITSTVEGLTSAKHIQSSNIASTMDYLLIETVSRSNIISTVGGLNTNGYISTTNLRSTVNYLLSNTPIKRSLYSTVRGLPRANYISSSHLASSVTSIIDPAFNVQAPSYFSSFTHLGTQSFVSTASYASSFRFLNRYIYTSNLTSTITGLTSFNSYMFISTSDLTSTIDTVFYNLSGQAASSIDGLGTLGYNSTLDMETFVEFTNNNFVSRRNIRSTVRGIGNIYISTSQLTSTTLGIDIATRYYPKYDAYYPSYDGPIGILNATSTIDGISNIYMTKRNLVSSANNLITNAVSPSNYISTYNRVGLNYIISSISVTNSLLNYYLPLYVILSTIDALGVRISGRFNKIISEVEFLSTCEVINGPYYDTMAGLTSSLVVGPRDGIYSSDEMYEPDIFFISPDQLISTTDFYLSKSLTGNMSYQMSNLIISLPRSPYIPYFFTGSLTSSTYYFLCNVVPLSAIRSTVRDIGGPGFRIITGRTSGTLVSTSYGILNYPGAVFMPSLQSTFIGIGAPQMGIGNNFFKGPSFGSTFVGISNTVIEMPDIQSTIDGLVKFYINSNGHVSTTESIYSRFVYSISSDTSRSRFENTQYIDTFNQLDFNMRYLSTAQLTSTISSLINGDAGLPTKGFLLSTIAGIGNLDYLSTSGGVSTCFYWLSNFDLYNDAINLANLLSTTTNATNIYYVPGLYRNSTINSVYNIPNAPSNGATTRMVSTTKFDCINMLSNIVPNNIKNSIPYYKDPKYILNIGTDSNGNGGKTSLILPDPYPSFIAVILQFTYGPGGQYGRYYATPMYSTNGQSWSSPSGYQYFDTRTQQLTWNGKYFYIIGSCYTDGIFAPFLINSNYMQYSYDGINWSLSTWILGQPFVGGTYSVASCASSRVSIWAPYGAYPRASLVYWSPNNPNVWYPPTSVNFISQPAWRAAYSNGPGANSNTTGPAATTSLQINAMTTNGVFFMISHNAGGAFGTGQGSALNFLSYNGSDWIQYGFAVANGAQVCFTVGRFIYVGMQTANTNYCRSIDGSNWFNNITISNVSVSLIQGNVNSQTIITPFNLGHSLFGGITFNPYRLFSSTFPLYTYANLPNVGLRYFRSIGNNVNRFISLNGNAASFTAFYTLDNFITTNNVDLPNPTSGYSAVATANTHIALVTSYDIAPPPQLELLGLSFAVYNGPITYLNLTSNSINFVATQFTTGGLSSNLIVFNDALFVNFNCNVTFGSVMPTDFGSCNSGGPTPDLTNINRSNLAQTFSSIAYADIDGLLRITGNAIKPTNANWVGYSDKRIKENIYPANLKQCYGVLSTIKLKHFSYISSYTGKYNLEDRSQLGFIAQEVSTLFPKSTPNRFDVLSTGDAYYDLCKGQLDMSHYGATQYLISSMYSRSSLIGNQMIQLETFEGIYSTIQRF
jgi:hypothetical protein